MLDTVILTIIYGVIAITTTVALIESASWHPFDNFIEKLMFGLLGWFFWYQLLRVWGVL